MKIKIFIILNVFLVTHLRAQLIFELKDEKLKSETIELDTKAFVIIKNMLPNQTNHRYTVEVAFEEEEIPPFETGAFSSTPCEKVPEKLQEAFKNFKNASKEADVPDLLKKLNKAIDESTADSTKTCIKEIRKVIRLTEYTKSLAFKIRPNQKITVTVVRITSSPKKDTATFTKVFKTITKSPWSIMYGITLIPNWMNPINAYYTKADTSGKFYTIEKQNNQRRDFLQNVSPTVMFQLKPVEYRSFSDSKGKIGALFNNRFYQVGLIAGLSLNFASETGVVNAMIGPSIVFANNVSISCGLAFTRKDVLKGRYAEGDVVKENLEFDQLHEKKGMAEWFVCIAFRFDKNPFKKEEKEETNEE